MRKQTVFIADDHKLVRDGVKRIVEEDKTYTVIAETGDGLGIIPIIRKFAPDILLLDISMPDMRGIEAIKKIRKFNRKTKILIVTMHKNEDYVCECLMSGANGYVLKEDADVELMNALHTIQNDKLYVSPLLSSDIIRNLIARKPDSRVSARNPSMRKLTPREQEVLTLIVEGYSNKKIGDIFSISVRTVEHHRLSAMRKLGTSNTVDLIKRAIKSGLVDII